MTNHLLLLDGSSLLFSSFFGNLPKEYKFARTDEEKDKVLHKLRQSPDGQFTNGVYTMLASMLKVINTQKPTHLAVAWDLTKEHTFRTRLYNKYKSNRKPVRNELAAQFLLAQNVLSQLGISQFVFDEYEADDIIGTFAEKFKNSTRISIWTKDQDSLQLIDENVSVWLITSKYSDMYAELGINTSSLNIPRGVFEYTPEYMEHFYGISPRQIIDKKAIEGDASDNIPGISGIGEKTVIPLLRKFKTVEGIYAFVENNSEVYIKEVFKSLGISRSPLSKLMEQSDKELVGKKAAELCKQLATIKCDIKELEPINLDSLKLQINEENLNKIFSELGFESLFK